MTNKEWMATLTAEQFYDEMMWLVRDFGFQFNNSRLGIIDWLDQPYRPEAKQMVFNDQRGYSPDEMKAYKEMLNRLSKPLVEFDWQKWLEEEVGET